jgi:hypothetical protein
LEKLNSENKKNAILPKNNFLYNKIGTDKNTNFLQEKKIIIIWPIHWKYEEESTQE